MTHPEGERATPTAIADHHVGADVVPPYPDGSGEEVKIMHTLTQDPEPVPLPQDARWFAALLLREPRQAVQTAPVIAMVAELLDILRDEQVSDQDARHALQRAVQWLRVFAGDPGRSPNRPAQVAGDREYAPSAEELVAAAASRRLAAA
jgi:hypothetical protein